MDRGERVVTPAAALELLVDLSYRHAQMLDDDFSETKESQEEYAAIDQAKIVLGAFLVENAP